MDGAETVTAHAIIPAQRPSICLRSDNPGAPPLLTKTVLFLGEGDMVGVSMPPYSGGNMFTPDKKTGKVLWEKDLLDAGTTSAPMSYMLNGKQYIVVAVGSTNHASEFVWELTLP